MVRVWVGQRLESSRSILKSRSNKSALVILLILAPMSQFKQIFKKFKIRKVQVLCAIPFGGIAMHLKVLAAFKLHKIMFFEGLNKALILNVKNMDFCNLKGTTTFTCVAILPNVMAHNASTFLFLEFF